MDPKQAQLRVHVDLCCYFFFNFLLRRLRLSKFCENSHFINQLVIKMKMNGIRKTEIVRWAVNTAAWNPTRTEWVTAMRLIANDSERTRINRFVFKKDAKHAIVGRLLIRKCCLDLLGSGQFTFDSTPQPDQLTIVRDEKGKPLLVQIQSDGAQSRFDRFQFNISHSGDYCVIAADNDTPKLGVDIMKVEYTGGMHRINDFFRIMHRQFTSDEWRYIESGGSSQSRLARFIRLWSLKESLVKAKGSGIVFPLSKINFTCPTELVLPTQKIQLDSSVEIDGERIHNWQFEESMIDRMHYVSVAKYKPNSTTSTVSENEIQTNCQFKLLSIHDLLYDLDPSLTGPLLTYDDEKYWTDFCRKS